MKLEDEERVMELIEEAGLDNRINTLAEENDSLKSSVSNLESTCDFLRGENESLKNDIISLENTVRDLESTVNSLNRGY